MREKDVLFYSQTFSTEDLIKLRQRKVAAVSELDARASKNAAKNRTRLLYHISVITPALALIGDKK
jgi:hypothetical protein